VLATLACHAPRRLDFRPAGDLHLGRDEDALLELLRSMQRHAPDASQELRVRSRDARAAALVALRWVGSATACLLAARLLRLADELAAGGLWIGSGEAAAWRAARAAPGAALRH
jgi:hypothetical protein